MANFSKNKFFTQIIHILLFIFVVCVLFWFVIFRAVTQAQEARFNVEAMQACVMTFRKYYQPAIWSFNDMGNCWVVEKDGKRDFYSEEIAGTLRNGYVYDADFYPDGKYVISASPVGLFNTGIEYGATEDTALRMNNSQVDANPDSYDAVKAWKAISRRPEEKLGVMFSEVDAPLKVTQPAPIPVAPEAVNAPGAVGPAAVPLVPPPAAPAQERFMGCGG